MQKENRPLSIFVVQVEYVHRDAIRDGMARECAETEMNKSE